MREIRAIRKGVNKAGSAAGAIAIPVVAIALAPQFLMLAAIATAIALLVIAVGMVRDHLDRPAPYRHCATAFPSRKSSVEDDAAAQAHRERMRATLGYDAYTR